MRELAPAPATFRIRKMALDDLDGVMALEQVAFTNPWSTDMVRRELSQDWSTVLVLEQPQGSGFRLLGFAIFWLVHDEVHILNVAVDPAERRRGAGRALMQAALELGRAHHCRLATLEVRRGNVAAIKLYESLKFRAVGLRPNYYADNREDAVVMLMDL